MLEKAKKLVGNGLDYSKLPLDDKKIYAMLAKGEAMGVFQFESSGMREALRQVKPTHVRRSDRARRALPAGPDAVHPVSTRGARTARSRSRSSTRA